MLLRKDKRVFVQLGFVDMRKQINGLSTLAQERRPGGPFDGSYFVFCGKTRRVIKILYWDRTGFCLWHLCEASNKCHYANRKNWLFSGSPLGAHASAGLYSLIETAKANGHDPFGYLCYLFDRLASCTNEDDFRSLLPYHLDPSITKPNAGKLTRTVVHEGLPDEGADYPGDLRSRQRGRFGRWLPASLL